MAPAFSSPESLEASAWRLASVCTSLLSCCTLQLMHVKTMAPEIRTFMILILILVSPGVTASLLVFDAQEF